MRKNRIATLSELDPAWPTHALVANVDLVMVRWPEEDACHTNNCPVGIATQRPELRARLNVDLAAKRLERFFTSAVEIMRVMARACGHRHLNQFSIDDLTT